MRMNRPMEKTVCYVLFFLLLCIPSHVAGGVVVSKYGGEFLRTGVGARPLGMGGAHVAVAEDVTAIYWNPAGLVSMRTLQIHGMHAERFSGIINWDFVGVGLPLQDHIALGFGFFRLGVDGIPFTELRNPSREIGEIYIDDSGRRVQNDVYASKYVDDSEMAFVFSFAKSSSDKFSFGGNVKVIRKSAGEYGAWGLGFDVGILLNPYRSLSIGLVLLDATSTLVAWNGGQREVIVPHLKMGMAYPVQIASFRFLPVLDVQMGFENRGSATQVALGRVGLDFCGGLEVDFRERLAMRVGTDRGHFTAGVGLRVSALNIDYGFLNHFDLGNTHRISVTLFLDGKRFPKF